MAKLNLRQLIDASPPSFISFNEMTCDERFEWLKCAPSDGGQEGLQV
jgi:hypothetical protein